jgi:hypothetical protein
MNALATTLRLLSLSKPLTSFRVPHPPPGAYAMNTMVANVTRPGSACKAKPAASAPNIGAFKCLD